MHNPLVPIAFPDRKQVLPDGATLLAADVSGTKTILALIEIHDGDASFIKETVYPSRQFGSLAEAVRTFMAGSSSRPQRFSIAFAGPVQEGKAYATNLGWHLDTRLLIEELGIPQVFLINDLEAEAYGLAALTEKDLVTIYPGKAQPKGNAAIIAPGTGWVKRDCIGMAPPCIRSPRKAGTPILHRATTSTGNCSSICKINTAT
ncbi:MAG: glucokinase [Lewinellaceae bacterium]|nr:glucokinase [Lewinellaceae bacterium]